MGVIAQHFRKAMTYRSKRGVRGPATINLTGTQYGTFPVWTPKSAQGKLVVEVTLTALGSSQVILSDADDANSNRMGWAISNSKFYFDYLDTTGVARTVTVGGAGFVVAGARNRIEVSFGAHGVTITANGVSSTLSYLIDQADLNLVRLSGALGGTNLLNGTIHRCEFIDLSPLQSVRAMGCASTRVPKIPAISLGIGSTIEVWLKHKLDAGAQSLFGFTGTASPVTITNGVAASSGPITLTQDGVAVSGSLADGRHCTLKATTTSAVTLTTLGENNAAANRLLDVAAWRIWDAATGKVWTYNNANDTGNLLENSSTVDRIGPELWVKPYSEFPACWTETASGDLICDGSQADGAQSVRVNRPALAAGDGVAHTVSFTVDSVSAGSVRVGVGSSYTNNISTPGTYSLTLRSATTDDHLRVRPDIDFVGRVSNISIRRIYALKTAEGAELWDVAKGVTLASGKIINDTVVIEGNTSTYAGDYNISLSVAPSSTYRINMDAEGSNLGYEIQELTSSGTYLRNRTHTGGSNAFGTGYLITGPDVGKLRFKLSRTSTAAGQAIYSKLSCVPVTHGLWHQSGAVMTDAAANAARAYLPPINRSYDFADSIPTLPAASPLQLARTLEPNGTSYWAAVTPLDFPGDFTFEVDWVRQDRGTGSYNHFLGDAAASVSRFIVEDSTHATMPNDAAVVVGGVSRRWSGVMAGIAMGSHVNLKLVRTGSNAELFVNGVSKGLQDVGSATFKIDRFFISSTAIQSRGATSIKLYDATTGKLWHYANLNDTGNVLTNLSSVDRLGGNTFDPAGLSENLSTTTVQGGNITAILNVDATGEKGPFVEMATVPGALYRFTANATNPNSNGQGMRLRVTASPWTAIKTSNVVAAGTSAPVSVDFVATSTLTRLSLSFTSVANLATHGTYSNVSIRRIYSLATAEVNAQNLVDFKLENLTVVGGIVNDLGDGRLFVDRNGQSNRLVAYFAIPTEVGKTYRLEMDAESFGPSNLVKLFVTDAVGTEMLNMDVNSTSNRGAHFTATATTSQVHLLPTGSVSNTAIFTGVSVVKTTDGIWHEDSTAMTAAAANAARTYLPALPKRLANGGDVLSVSGQEGVELWVEPATSIQSGWTSNGGGSYTRVADSVATEINRTVATVPSGATCIFTIKIDALTSVAGFKVRVQGGADVNIPAAVGTYSVICVAGSVGSSRVRSQDESTAGTISNISIRETNAVEWTGLTADNIIEGELA